MSSNCPRLNANCAFNHGCPKCLSSINPSIHLGANKYDLAHSSQKCRAGVNLPYNHRRVGSVIMIMIAILTVIVILLLGYTACNYSCLSPHHLKLTAVIVNYKKYIKCINGEIGR